MDGGITYRAFRQVVKLILHVYYRSIEVYGRSYIPRGGRTLFVANHQTGLVDGLLVVGTNEFVVRTLAKNTLWDNPIIALFANALRMIPVYRKQDMAGEKAAVPTAVRNKMMFDGVEQAFENQQNVLLFPEGVSHDNPHMLKLRSGAARMLLQTEAAHDFRLGLKWLPISLDFEMKDQLGTRVLMHYHPARPVARYRDAYAQDSEGAVEALRHEMEEYLREVTINFETWEGRIFIERLTEIWLSRSPANLLLDRHNHLLKWKRVIENTSSEDRATWLELKKSVDELYGSLTLLNLTPHDLFRGSTKSQRKLMFKVLFRTFCWSPLILTGLVFWKAPSVLINFIAKKGASSKDVVPSYRIVAGVGAYPLWILFLYPWAVGLWGNTTALGLLIIALAAGFSVFTVSRSLRLQVRQVVALYRFGNLTRFFSTSRERIDDVCNQAARLWNRGLRRQILIEAMQPDANKKAS